MQVLVQEKDRRRMECVVECYCGVAGRSCCVKVRSMWPLPKQSGTASMISSDVPMHCWHLALVGALAAKPK